MYMVIYRNDYHGTFTVIAENLQTIEAARAARVVSGDLVVDVLTGKVLKDTAWLWDWEKAAGNDSYAYRMRGIDIDIRRRNNWKFGKE